MRERQGARLRGRERERERERALEQPQHYTAVCHLELVVRENEGEAEKRNDDAKKEKRIEKRGMC